MTEQLIAIFVFGLVVTGVLFLGVVRAHEVNERLAKVRIARRKVNSRN